MKNKTFITAVYASFAWNLYLVGGVMLGASFALDRAAGGQFEVFPTYIRIIYILNFALIVYQVMIFGRYEEYGVSIKPKWIVKAFVILGVLGILANVASRSANERWNVIPAIIITFAFYRILKSDTKNIKVVPMIGRD
jgi:hypothetical protein